MGCGSRAAVAAATTCGSSPRTAPPEDPGAAGTLPGSTISCPGPAWAATSRPASRPGSEVAPDGRALLFTAPIRGSYELWRVDLERGDVERLTEDRHYLSGWHAVSRPDGGLRVAAVRSTPVEVSEVAVLDLDAAGRNGAGLSRATHLNDDVVDDLGLRMPEERWCTVDGREVQAWLVRAAATDAGPAPLVLEIHGGPTPSTGWSPGWEFQVLAAAGISVVYANPRGSEGYGEDFNAANLPDWGDGPMCDALAHVDAIVAAGIADPARLGVTGGSYGGYLTNWIVGHTDRFAAALTCRSVT